MLCMIEFSILYYGQCRFLKAALLEGGQREGENVIRLQTVIFPPPTVDGNFLFKETALTVW